jgi:hypothetical protein
MVVISGSLAAVNALFLACRINDVQLTGQRLLSLSVTGIAFFVRHLYDHKIDAQHITRNGRSC